MLGAMWADEAVALGMGVRSRGHCGAEAPMWVHSQFPTTLPRSGLRQVLPILSPPHNSHSPSWHLSTRREDPKGQG